MLAGGMSGQAGAWAAVMHNFVFSDPRVVEKGESRLISSAGDEDISIL